MACRDCGRNRTDHDRAIYTAALGWRQCDGYIEGGYVDAPYVLLKGVAAGRKLYTDTKAFRDKSVRDAEAKKRRVAVGR